MKPGEVFAFNWTMPPSDATDSFLEIWVEGGATIEVQVTPPYGETASGWVADNKMKLWQVGQGDQAETIGALINIGQSTELKCSLANRYSLSAYAIFTRCATGYDFGRCF